MRLTISQTAKIIGTSNLTVQILMNKKLINIGDILPGKKRNTYIIYSSLLAKHLGISEDELINQIKN